MKRRREQIGRQIAENRFEDNLDYLRNSEWVELKLQQPPERAADLVARLQEYGKRTGREIPPELIPTFMRLKQHAKIKEK
jgi:hypothetical protein